ncbi:MAG: hypothetical protein NUV53_04345 [Patescibacteria group bacterium]|nr:hypothetical protein [Patescibacteria group bacterium]
MNSMNGNVSVDTELSTGFTVVVQVNGTEIKGISDHAGSYTIARRAGFVLGEHGWNVACNVNEVFELVLFYPDERRVIVKVKADAPLSKSERRVDANAYGRTSEWNTRKHHEVSAEIAHNDGRPLHHGVSRHHHV